MDLDAIKGLDAEEVRIELARGARFVVFQYTISVVVASFRRSSRVHLVRNGESARRAGGAYTLISILLGWWGVPWGPVFTVQSVAKNFRGGEDVTDAVLACLSELEVASRAGFPILPAAAPHPSWQPLGQGVVAPAVAVLCDDGHHYPGNLMASQDGYCLVAFPDAGAQWVAKEAVRPAA